MAMFGSLATGAAGTISGIPPVGQSGGSGLQIEELELEDFGFDPSAFFFFTGNTAYKYQGLQVIEIIAAAIDPAGATSLTGITTHDVTFMIDGSGNILQISGTEGQDIASVPEPPVFCLFGIGFALIPAWLLFRTTIRASA